MANRQRPDERLNLVIERKGRRIRVKAYLYSGERLVATATPWHTDMVDEQGSERSVSELIDVRDDLMRRCRLWASQQTLFDVARPPAPPW